MVMCAATFIVLVVLCTTRLNLRTRRVFNPSYYCSSFGRVEVRPMNKEKEEEEEEEEKKTHGRSYKTIPAVMDE